MISEQKIIWLAPYESEERIETSLKNLSYIRLYGEQGVSMKLGFLDEEDAEKEIGSSKPIKGILRNIDEDPIEEINYCLSLSNKLQYIKLASKSKSISAGTSTAFIQSFRIPDGQKLLWIIATIKDDHIAGLGVRVGKDDEFPREEDHKEVLPETFSNKTQVENREISETFSNKPQVENKQISESFSQNYNEKSKNIRAGQPAEEIEVNII